MISGIITYGYGYRRDDPDLKLLGAEVFSIGLIKGFLIDGRGVKYVWRF